jgi:hypothetical protein
MRQIFIQNLTSHDMNVFLNGQKRLPLECIAQRYTEITHGPLLFSVAQGIFLTVQRETLTQYITFKRGGRGESVLLYTVVLQL